MGLGSGPLFGVQFSSAALLGPGIRRAGPRRPTPSDRSRSPIGLAGDPGGFPLYKNGVVVGGVGVKADGDYGFDPDVRPTPSR